VCAGVVNLKRSERLQRRSSLKHVYFTLGCGRHAPLSFNIAVIVVEATPTDGAAALLGGDGLPGFSLNIFANVGWCANFVG